MDAVFFCDPRQIGLVGGNSFHEPTNGSGALGACTRRNDQNLPGHTDVVRGALAYRRGGDFAERLLDEVAPG